MVIFINTFNPNGISHSYQLDQSISILMMLVVFFIFMQILVEYSLSKQ